MVGAGPANHHPAAIGGGWRQRQGRQPTAGTHLRSPAAQVFYHLGDLDDALTYALGAGALFDVGSRTEYVQTILGEGHGKALLLLLLPHNAAAAATVLLLLRELVLSAAMDCPLARRYCVESWEQAIEQLRPSVPATAAPTASPPAVQPPTLPHTAPQPAASTHTSSSA